MSSVQKTMSNLRSRVEGYEKTEDTAISEKTSLVDQEDARLIFLNQPQLTKFCSNHFRQYCVVPGLLPGMDS
uniref:Uncharacterized protein n=1 Tax=Oncorhynchus tshawytscha TaxID=74940 RepID=A0A8C8I5H7_ONCTS